MIFDHLSRLLEICRIIPLSGLVVLLCPEVAIIVGEVDEYGVGLFHLPQSLPIDADRWTLPRLGLFVKLVADQGYLSIHLEVDRFWDLMHLFSLDLKTAEDRTLSKVVALAVENWQVFEARVDVGGNRNLDQAGA